MHFTVTQIYQICKKKIVDPSYEMKKSIIDNKLIDQIKVYSNEELALMKKSIIDEKIIEHLGRVIKDFLEFYPNEKYPKDKNTIKDQLNYYNDVIRKKILNIDSNSDNSESNLGDIYNKEKNNFTGENPMLSPP